MLGGDVSGEAADRFETRRRGHVDDCASSALEYRGNLELEREEDAFETDRQRAAELILAHLGERRWPVTSARRIVDGDVQASQRIQRRRDKPLDGLRLGDVRRRDHGATAVALDLGGHAGESLLVASRQDDRGAGAGHRSGDLRADPTARAGDKRAPPLE